MGRVVKRRESESLHVFRKDGLFDLQLLGRFNGVTGPIFMGVCGKVEPWNALGDA